MNNASKFLTFGALLIPLKLSFSYIILLPLILYFIYKEHKYLGNEIKNNPFIKYSLYFFIIIICSSFFGFQDLTGKSLVQVMRLLFVALLIPLTSFYICSEKNIKNLIIALGIGQSIAGFHSLYQYINPQDQRQIFIGVVTESGQLAITIPLLLGIVFDNKQSKNKLAALTFLLILSIFIFNNLDLKILSYVSLGLLVVTLIYALVRSMESLPLMSLIICISSLLVNLKRGPLIGVFVACLFFSSKLYPVASLIFTILIAAIFYSFEPLRNRILSIYDHFSISGGREEIWELGLNYLRKYPLGIGYDNSRVISKYSLSIPSDLKHFHNNYLNFAVELGIPALIFFLILIGYLLSKLYKLKTNLALSVFACITSLLLAGVVEYNLGDSEILLLFLMVLGIANYIIFKATDEKI